MGTNLITTLIGFGLSTTFIVFVCARLVCTRMRSAEARAAAAAHAPTAFDLELQIDSDQSHHNIDGPETVDIAMIPTMKYRKGSFSSNEDTQCSICLGEYQEKEVLRIMPICNHNFHLKCVDEWFTRQLSCPICRLPIRDYLEEKYLPSPPSREALQTGVAPAIWHLDHESPRGVRGNQLFH